MRQYHCIFKSLDKHVYNSDVGILAVSNNGTGYDECVHCRSNESRHKSYSAEGLYNWQSKCTGHRLAVTNYRSKAPAEVRKNEHITAEQYNKLVQLVQEELSARKRSPLYSNASISEKPTVDSNETILRNQLSSLNTYIKSNGFYKDTMRVPTISISSDEACAADINKSVAAVKMMLNDCICYSDCNSYSTCQCYGNCNHY